MGATGKGAAIDLPSLPISLKLQINKMHFSTCSPVFPISLELTEKAVSGLGPHLGTEPHLLGDCELEGGNKRQGRYRGFEEKKGQQSGLQAPGEKFRRGPKNPHHSEPRALFLWTASVLHYCARHTASESAGASCLGSNPGSAPY